MDRPSTQPHPDKQTILQHFIQLADTKIAAFQLILDDLREALRGDTKSTAGDKHETGRAMVQIEQENASRQLQEVAQQKEELLKINGHLVTEIIVKGSVVHTNRGCFLMSTGLGKLAIDGHIVFALSPQSPLGMKLMGKSAGDELDMMSAHFIIEKIS